MVKQKTGLVENETGFDISKKCLEINTETNLTDPSCA
jgi:hypothetical protein